MNSAKPLPLGFALRSREQGERLNEEIYRTIPALNGLARAAEQVAAKLSLEARNALFFSREAAPELRTLNVEVALAKRDAVSNPQPDLAWLASMERVAGQRFERKNLHDDFWLEPGV